MKIKNIILIAAVCITLLPALSLAEGPLPVDLKDSPEAKSRNIRTGDSLEAVRADALQTMDFGIEIMGDVLEMTNYREDVVIIRWEETRDKYMNLWRNTWDWFENTMKEKKMDLTKQKEWRKKYDTFLDSVVADGEAVVHWKWQEEIYRKNLDIDLKAMPKELTELKNTVKEANTLLTDAQALANKSGVTASDVNQALDKVEMAENLVEKVSKQMAATREFIKKEQAKKKTSLDSNITQIRDRLKACTSNNPDIMNRWTTEIATWSNHVDNYWEYYKKSWTAWENMVKPYLVDDLFKDYSFFKDVKYADLTKVTEQARKKLEAMK